MSDDTIRPSGWAASDEANYREKRIKELEEVSRSHAKVFQYLSDDIKILNERLNDFREFHSWRFDRLKKDLVFSLTLGILSFGFSISSIFKLMGWV